MLPSAIILAIIFFLGSNILVPGLIIPSSTKDPKGILGLDLLFFNVSKKLSSIGFVLFSLCSALHALRGNGGGYVPGVRLAICPLFGSVEFNHRVDFLGFDLPYSTVFPGIGKDPFSLALFSIYPPLRGINSS